MFAKSSHLVTTICLIALAACTSQNSPAPTSELVSAPTTTTAQTKTHELVLYRPGNSTFYIMHEGSKQPANSVQFGTVGDIPLWADFTGSGKSSPGLYRKGEWLISTHTDGKPDIVIYFGGEPNDIPLAADLDGDGKADEIIFRDGLWFVRESHNPDANPKIYAFGATGDIPVLGDFNGDSKVDLAVFRNGEWLVDTLRNGKVNLTFNFGSPSDKHPIAVDWHGTGKVSPTLFRDGNWLIDHGPAAPIGFGGTGDIPLSVILKL